MVQKALFLVNTSPFKKMTTVIPIKRLWLFLKNKVFTTFEPCRIKLIVARLGATLQYLRKKIELQNHPSSS